VGSRRIAVDAASASNASVISSWLNRLASNGTSGLDLGTRVALIRAHRVFILAPIGVGSRRRDVGPASGAVGILTYVAEVGIAGDPDLLGESAPNERVL
jgi:hypothetical protein